MRWLIRVFLLLFVFAAIAGGADAKEGKNSKGGGGPKNKSHVERTGIAAFDDVFGRVGEIDRRLDKADGQLRDGKTNLNTALGLKEGTPLSDGIAELQKRAGNKLGLSMGGSIPKLQVSDAVPSDVQAAVDAINGMTTNFSGSIEDLAGLAPEIDKLVKQSAKIPSRLKDEFLKGNVSWLDKIFKLPKIAKAVGKNVKLTAGLPGRATSITGRMTDTIRTVSSEFGAGGGGGGGSDHGNGNGNNGNGNGKGNDKGGKNKNKNKKKN